MSRVLKSRDSIHALYSSLCKNGSAPHKVNICALLHNVLKGIIHHEAVVDDWPDYSSIVLRPTAKETREKSYYVYTSNPSTLQPLLKDYVSWSPKTEFAAVAPETWDAIEGTAKQFGLKSTVLGSLLFSFKELHANTAMRSLPDGLTIDRCYDTDAQTISDHWEFSQGDSTVEMIKYAIEHLPSACVRSADGKPVAWGIQELDGQLGMGYTLPEYRRRHLSKAVLQELLVKITQDGGWRFGYAGVSNNASIQHGTTYDGTDGSAFRCAWVQFTHESDVKT